MQRVTQLLLGDGALIHKKETKGKAVTAGTIAHGTGEQPAHVRHQMGLQTVRGAEPAAIENDAANLQQNGRPQTSAVRAVGRSTT